MMLFVVTIINKFKYFTIKIDRGSKNIYFSTKNYEQYNNKSAIQIYSLFVERRTNYFSSNFKK